MGLIYGCVDYLDQVLVNWKDKLLLVDVAVVVEDFLTLCVWCRLVALLAIVSCQLEEVRQKNRIAISIHILEVLGLGIMSCNGDCI